MRMLFLRHATLRLGDWTLLCREMLRPQRRWHGAFTAFACAKFALQRSKRVAPPIHATGVQAMRILTSITAIVGLVLALSAPLLHAEAAPEAKPATENKTPVCAGCHEQSHMSIAPTAHGARNDAAGTMCQACHGDASAHITDPAKNPMKNV